FHTMFCDDVAVEQDLGRIDGCYGKGHLPEFMAQERTAASIERIAGRADRGLTSASRQFQGTIRLTTGFYECRTKAAKIRSDSMVTKLLAASVLTIGLATSAMAQSLDDRYSNNHDWWLFGNNDQTTVDPYTTGSISDGSGLNTQGNTGAIGPCAHNTPGPDANAGQNVNDQYCGK
ncbi:hypothetical protein, partial [Mesorhizobium sp. M7A.F.Ca.CA.003.01.2.1]